MTPDSATQNQPLRGPFDGDKISSCGYNCGLGNMLRILSCALVLTLFGGIGAPKSPGASSHASLVPLRIDVTSPVPAPELEVDGHASALPRFTPGGEVYLDEIFVGFPPTLIAVASGVHNLLIRFDRYPGTNVTYKIKLEVTTRTLKVHSPSFEVGSCWDADSDRALKWKAAVVGTFDLAAGTPSLAVPGPLNGYDPCQYELRFGADRYFKLNISSEPVGAQIRIQNYLFGTTPRTVVIRKYVYDDGPSLKVALSKQGFYSSAILVDIVHGQNVVTAKLRPLNATP